jgi:hypothetical protein
MNATRNLSQRLNTRLKQVHLRRGLAFGLIILSALVAFELFNFSTTEYALTDLLGDLKFAGITWATILAIAFCGIDFAGIARLFTPGEEGSEVSEVWYLFAAWLLAATMNAMLTWWGVSLALISHESLGSALVGRQSLIQIVPIFVAVLVWLSRVLIIGTFSVAGGRIFRQGEESKNRQIYNRNTRPMGSQASPASAIAREAPRAVQASAVNQRPVSRPSAQVDRGAARPEPTYHPLNLSASAQGDGSVQRSASMSHH